MSPRRAQTLVEFAVLLPVLLLILLGGIETGFLFRAVWHQDRATYTVAQYAAQHDDDSWHSVAEQVLAGCDVSREDHLGVVTITATCTYHPVVLVMWNGLPMTSRESSTTSSSPAASPTSSPAPTPAGTSS